MQKKAVKKPSIFFSVILPIVLSEIIFIAVSILSFMFLKENLKTPVILTVIFGFLFLLIFVISIIIYILRYFQYEKYLSPKANLHLISLVGFLMITVSLLLNAIFNWIPFVGSILSMIFSLIIIAGGIISIISVVRFRKGEKGKGLANVGAFLGVSYIVHLILTLILAIVAFALIASFIE